MIPKFHVGMTIGECLDPALDITRRGDRDEALRYLTEYVVFLRDAFYPDDEELALKMAKENIGYYAGYCDFDMMRAVQNVFGAVHPIFGRQDVR